MYEIQLLCTSMNSVYFTDGKSHDFSVTQNLREINFGQFRSNKTAVFAI